VPFGAHALREQDREHDREHDVRVTRGERLLRRFLVLGIWTREPRGGRWLVWVILGLVLATVSFVALRAVLPHGFVCDTLTLVSLAAVYVAVLLLGSHGGAGPDST